MSEEKKPTLRERFEAKYTPEPNTGCWLWTAAATGADYGHFWNGHKQDLAHRVAYKLYVGPIPDELQIDHLCRVRCCVNPSHLRTVTSKENTFAPGSLARTLANAKKTECKYGHDLTGSNMRVGPDGRRRCRSCERNWAKTYYDQRRSV